MKVIKIKGFFFMVLASLFIVTACSKGDETAEKGGNDEVAAYGGAETPGAVSDKAELPSGHPTVSDKPSGIPGITGPATHPESKTHKEVQVSDEVKAKWKGVKLSVAEGEGGDKKTLSIDVGNSAQVGGYKLSVEVFLPDYAMFDDYISSRSTESRNPAVLVELFEGDKSVAKGWVFKNFPQFNSYKDAPVTLVLIDGEAA